mgnify:CR=1 FL=1
MEQTNFSKIDLGSLVKELESRKLRKKRFDYPFCLLFNLLSNSRKKNINKLIVITLYIIITLLFISVFLINRG